MGDENVSAHFSDPIRTEHLTFWLFEQNEAKVRTVEVWVEHTEVDLDLVVLFFHLDPIMIHETMRLAWDAKVGSA